MKRSRPSNPRARRLLALAAIFTFNPAFAGQPQTPELGSTGAGPAPGLARTSVFSSSSEAEKPDAGTIERRGRQMDRPLEELLIDSKPAPPFTVGAHAGLQRAQAPRRLAVQPTTAAAAFTQLVAYLFAWLWPFFGGAVGFLVAEIRRNGRSTTSPPELAAQVAAAAGVAFALASGTWIGAGFALVAVVSWRTAELFDWEGAQ